MIGLHGRNAPVMGVERHERGESFTNLLDFESCCQAFAERSREIRHKACDGFATARYSVLHESRQIFTARCLCVLPTEEELRRELERERRLLEMQHAPEEEPEEE